MLWLSAKGLWPAASRRSNALGRVYERGGDIARAIEATKPRRPRERDVRRRAGQLAYRYVGKSIRRRRGGVAECSTSRRAARR